MSLTQDNGVATREAEGEVFDAIVIGAGFAGLYQLERLRSLGHRVRVLEAGGDIGGIWYWNCYPGARVDTIGGIYQYSRDDLWKDWDYTELYPSWEEVRAYFKYVDERLDLSKDVQFNTRVVRAEFDESDQLWTVYAQDGSSFQARFVVSCIGFAAKPFIPSIPGLDDFRGEVHHTAQWPQEGLDFAGKRVGVIGTGASGVQVIQEASKTAAHLTVFQRTPMLALPMRQRELDDQARAEVKASLPERFQRRAETFAGFDIDFLPQGAGDVTQEERLEIFERLWEAGGFHPWLGTFNDILFGEEGNDAAYAFWRDKTRARIQDPRIAEVLAPTVAPHPFGVKRPSLEQDYYESFNRDNVTLVDIKRTPIEWVTPAGVTTADGVLHELDILVLATGFDALTGGLFDMDIRGTGGIALQDKWNHGVRAHLGVATAGFPNFLMVYGPQSPAGFCNGPTCAELQGEQIVQVLDHVLNSGLSRIEATSEAEEEWRQGVLEVTAMTLFDKADSWYLGANVPGKPREMINYPAGVPTYLAKWGESVEGGYSGFELS